MYKTTRRALKIDSRRSAQAQVNRHLAEFVDDYDDTNTLLIIYYAGHGRPGNDPGVLKLSGLVFWYPVLDLRLTLLSTGPRQHLEVRVTVKFTRLSGVRLSTISSKQGQMSLLFLTVATLGS
jgi:hypothetical protein